MYRMKKDLKKAINSAENAKTNPDLLEVAHLNKRDGNDCKLKWAGSKGRAEYFLREGIQYVCHQKNKKTGELLFIAIDPFCSFHFSLKNDTVGPVEMFIGNNE